MRRFALVHWQKLETILTRLIGSARLPVELRPSVLRAAGRRALSACNIAENVDSRFRKSSQNATECNRFRDCAAVAATVASLFRF